MLNCYGRCLLIFAPLSQHLVLQLSSLTSVLAPLLGALLTRMWTLALLANVIVATTAWATFAAVVLVAVTNATSLQLVFDNLVAFTKAFVALVALLALTFDALPRCVAELVGVGRR